MSWVTTTSAAANTASVGPGRRPPSRRCGCRSCPRCRRGSPGHRGQGLLRASMTGGSGSYSTSISSRASRAEYRSSATTNATSWPWKRTLSVASTACTSWDSVGIQASFSVSRTAPVMTALTFGCASAARRVDRDDPGVGVRAAQDRAVQHARQVHVVDVGALAADEPHVLLAQHAAEPHRVLGSLARGGSGRAPSGHAVPPSVGDVRRPSGWTARCSRSRCSGRAARRWPRGSRPRRGSVSGPAGRGR